MSSRSSAASPRNWTTTGPESRGRVLVASRLVSSLFQGGPWSMSPAPRVLMCPPDYYGIEYEINPWMHREVASDPMHSLVQWWALHDALRDLGALIERLEPVPGLPDLV